MGIQHYRVGVFGHYGNKNLGDESIIWSVIQNLHDRIPDIEFTGFSMKPSDTTYRYNIEAFPIRYVGHSSKSGQPNNREDFVGIPMTSIANSSLNLHIQLKGILADKVRKSTSIGGLIYLLSNLGAELRFLGRIKEWLKSVDALVVCGSNQLLDNFGGPWGFPFTLLKWTLLAKSTGTKIFFVSMGAGPLSNPLSFSMLKMALVRADYLSYRDIGSKKLIEDRLAKVEGPVYPDLAHSLKMLPKNGEIGAEHKKVAINPMPVFDKRYWYKSDPQKYEAYITHLARFINYITSRGYQVNLFNNHPKDLLVIDDIFAEIQNHAATCIDKVHIIKNETVQDLVNTIAEADIIIATRFHSVVLPVRLGKPVLAISYYRKSRELLEDLGLGNYSVDINQFTAEELYSKFNSLVENTDSTQNVLQCHYKRYTQLLDEQWDRLADLIKS